MDGFSNHSFIQDPQSIIELDLLNSDNVSGAIDAHLKIKSFALSGPVFVLLLLVYVIVVLLSTLGPLLVIFVVLRTKQLRTHSNIYLVNLAVSDLFLVLLACPLTFMQVL